jgi:hypothetical protein
VILYCAGNMAPEILAAMAERTGAQNWLETYAHKGSRDCADHFTSFECMEQRFRLFVDSGAFTFWCKGKAIDHDDHDAYIAYAKNLLYRAVYPERVVVASLDIIPGTLEGDYPTEEEFHDAATRGWANYQREKAAGLKTIPTFHQGDPWQFLDMMATDTDYIGISPRKVDQTIQEKLKWLNDVFRRIDAMGKAPKPGNMHKALKTHGLGVSSPVLMETYPWFSVDSRSWLLAGKGYFFSFDGRKIQRVPSGEWSRRADESGHTLSAIRHYKPPFKANLVYYYHEKAMQADAELNAYMTEHWEVRGVDWNHDSEAPLHRTS